MNPHLCKYISLIKAESKDCKVGIFTNATLLNEKIAENLLDSGLDQLSFSIDGDDSAVVDKIRKGSNVNKILQNIILFENRKKTMNKESTEISATTVLQKKNYKLLPNLIKTLADIGIKNLSVNGLEPYSEDLVEDVLWQVDSIPYDLLDVLKTSIEIAEQKNITLRLASFFPDTPICPDINTPIVLSNGDVVPCAVLAYERDYIVSVDNVNKFTMMKGRSKRLIFGNIKENKFENIWFGENYSNFRDSVQKQEYPEECRHCLIKHHFICVRSGIKPRKVLDQLSIRLQQ